MTERVRGKMRFLFQTSNKCGGITEGKTERDLFLGRLGNDQRSGDV